MYINIILWKTKVWENLAFLWYVSIEAIHKFISVYIYFMNYSEGAQCSDIL